MDKNFIKRKLTSIEIDNILDFIKLNTYIPKETAQSIVDRTKNQLIRQLKMIEVYPPTIPTLKENIKTFYLSSLAQPGESVGFLTAQSIGEKQTQSTLNSFHKAGSSDKQPVVSKFSELLNATNKPKAPTFTIYFNGGNNSVPELREILKHSLVQLTLKKISTEIEIWIDKKEELWYPAFYALAKQVKPPFTDCLTCKINMDLLYEYKLSLSDIADFLHKEYCDIYCIYSPDCYGQLDIYFDTVNINLPEEKLIFVTQENAREIYLEEVAKPILEKAIICGIPGIMNMFFLQDEGKERHWIVETENAREKVIDALKFKKNKEKPLDSVKRFKRVLAHPAVDMMKTLSNNVWDIYHVFGIEAIRYHMITEFCKIMKGINTCHVMVLVDRMTYSGSIASISRYSMRQDDSGPLARSSFEEILDNFLNAGIFAQEEPTKGVSSSIICGKRSGIGTGFCDITINLKKLN